MTEAVYIEPKYKKQINGLIKKIDCNYDDGTCLLYDCLCFQMNDSNLICSHFYDVLLEDPEGEALKAIAKTDTDKRIRCTKCGKLISVKSNRTKYCNDCAKVVRREKEAERKRLKYWEGT